MKLNTKYKLDLDTHDAQALRRFLIHAVAQPQESAYYQLAQILAARVAQKIHRKDTGEGLKLKLSVEEALAVQIIVATNEWPGNMIDNVLYQAQNFLPPLTINFLASPPRISWDNILDEY